MPNRKRRQARDFKYARFDEHQLGDRQPPRPFLAPALERVSLDIKVNDRFTPRVRELWELWDELFRVELGRQTLPW